MIEVPLNALETPILDTEGKTELHYSDMSAFKTCRRAWNFSSRLRLGLEPRRVYTPFFFGRAIHYCMEQLYAFDTPYDEALATFMITEQANLERAGPMMDVDKQTITEQKELALGLLKHYSQWEARQAGPFSMKNLEFVTLEQEFSIPVWNPQTGDIHPKAYFAGKWDGIIRRRDNGDMYIWELKTARAIPQRVKLLANDEQATLYLNAARYALGPMVKGVLYTIMGKRVPKMPKINQSGMLSTAVTDQSFDSYLAGIKLHHGPIATSDWITAHYGPTLVALFEGENTHFQRHIVTRNNHALDDGMRTMWNVANEITSPDLTIYPSPGFSCGYCIMHRPCIATQDGKDLQYILDTEYQSRANADEVVEVE